MEEECGSGIEFIGFVLSGFLEREEGGYIYTLGFDMMISYKKQGDIITA